MIQLVCVKYRIYTNPFYKYLYDSTFEKQDELYFSNLYEANLFFIFIYFMFISKRKYSNKLKNNVQIKKTIIISNKTK